MRDLWDGKDFGCRRELKVGKDGKDLWMELRGGKDLLMELRGGRDCKTGLRDGEERAQDV